jgi:hypothetical protein
MKIVEFLTSNATDLLTLLSYVLAIFSIVANKTPTESDNKILDVVLKVVHALGLTKK